jgi:hypothetical protein
MFVRLSCLFWIIFDIHRAVCTVLYSHDKSDDFYSTLESVTTQITFYSYSNTCFVINRLLLKYSQKQNLENSNSPKKY